MQQISQKDAREADRWASESLGIPPLLLMENAGAGAAVIALGMLMNKGFQGDGPPVVCVAGTGGNGGDALVAARHLCAAGFLPRIALWKPAESTRESHERAIHEAICRRLGLPCAAVTTIDDVASLRAALGRAPLVIDGLFGSGLARPVSGVAAGLIDALNEEACTVLALDLPSGLDCDTGRPLGTAVRATATATFLRPKLGFANPASRAFTGDVHVVGIGVPLGPPPRAG